MNDRILELTLDAVERIRKVKLQPNIKQAIMNDVNRQLKEEAEARNKVEEWSPQDSKLVIEEEPHQKRFSTDEGAWS